MLVKVPDYAPLPSVPRFQKAPMHGSPYLTHSKDKRPLNWLPPVNVRDITTMPVPPSMVHVGQPEGRTCPGDIRLAQGPPASHLTFLYELQTLCPASSLDGDTAYARGPHLWVSGRYFKFPTLP